MSVTSNKSAWVGHARRRTLERLLAVALLALAAALAWSAGHAGASPPAACQAMPAAQASLRQGIAATRMGPMGYYRFGHGSPLVLITGYRATLSEWNAAFLDALARHHEVIVVDNPGVGRSRIEPVPDTMAGMSEAISGAIDTLRLGKVDVLGWSMGGMVAQQLALDHPDQVGSLVLMATTPPGNEAVPASPAVEAVLSGGSPSPFESIMGVLFPPDARTHAMQCFRAEMFKPSDYGKVGVDERVADAQSRAMSAWWRDGEAARALDRLAAPTLVIMGDRDDVLSPRNASVLVRRLPHAALLVVADGGHALMYQDPQGVARGITRFLAAHP